MGVGDEVMDGATVRLPPELTVSNPLVVAFPGEVLTHLTAVLTSEYLHPRHSGLNPRVNYRHITLHTIAAQDEGEWYGAAKQGAERFMTRWIAAERARAALRHAETCPNVTGRTKERVAQSKRARTGLLATIFPPLGGRYFRHLPACL